MEKKELIEVIWEYCIKRKNLGARRMKKILGILIKIADADADVDKYRYYSYRKNNHNEWLECNGFQLYKSNSGYFILTSHDVYYKEDWFCRFDLNLAPVYHSRNEVVWIDYDRKHKDDYDADIIKYKQKYKGSVTNE